MSGGDRGYGGGHDVRLQSLEKKYRQLDAEWCFPELYGGEVNNASINSAAAIQRAFDEGYKTVRLKAGTYYVKSLITVPAYGSIVSDGRGKLQKAYNGDVVNLGTAGTLQAIQIEGQGATFTGRGVILPAGTSFQRIDDCRIVDTASYCVEHTAPQAGVCSVIDGGLLQPRNSTIQPAIRWPDELSAGGDRIVSGVNCGGGVLIDLGECDNGTVINCNTTNVIFRANGGTYGGAKKVRLIGNRIANGAIGSTLSIKGASHSFSGNTISGNIELASGAIDCRYDESNVQAAGFNRDDNSGNSTNYICQEINLLGSLAPTWQADTTNPTIGTDGSISGRYVRKGRQVWVTILLNMGTAANGRNSGVGNWKFKLPAALQKNAIAQGQGTVWGLRTGVALRAGVAFVEAGTFDIRLVSDQSGNFWNGAVPVAWGDNDYLRIAVSYEIG